MRILYVGPVAPIRGGIAQHGDRLIAALRGAGHQVTVATWRAQYPSLFYKGTQPAATEFASEVQPILSWWNPVSWWKTRRLARRHEITIIQWVHPVQALPVGVVTRGARRKAVAVVHNALPHERFPLAKQLTRFALRPVGRFVTHAADQERIMDDIVGEHDGTTTPHPPNLDIAPAEPPPAPPWRALFAGYVRDYKGPDIAIEAIAELRKRGFDAELSILGSFWEPEERYRSLAEQLGVAGHVALTNSYLADDAMAEAFQSHHLVVAPYRSATQSGLIPLALSAGRPVVASDVGGLAEQVPDGAGAICTPGSADSLADAMEAVIDDYHNMRRHSVNSAPLWSDVVEAIVGSPPRLS